LVAAGALDVQTRFENYFSFFGRPSSKQKSRPGTVNHRAAGLISSAAGLSDTAGALGGFSAFAMPVSGISEACPAGLPE
jgi:hypothetical protein